MESILISTAEEAVFPFKVCSWIEACKLQQM